MAKNKKISDISETLKEQAKERFNSVDEAKIKENDIASAETTEKIRKNFYIESRLVKLLRRMAYEEETDQTKIVNEALEEFFKARGYLDD